MTSFPKAGRNPWALGSNCGIRSGILTQAETGDIHAMAASAFMLTLVENF
jgi:hypothetical protein